MDVEMMIIAAILISIFGFVAIVSYAASQWTAKEQAKSDSNWGAIAGLLMGGIIGEVMRWSMGGVIGVFMPIIGGGLGWLMGREVYKRYKS